MKKKILFSFLIFFIGLFLVGCDDIKHQFSIDGIKGYEATINNEKQTIIFSVNEDVETFNTNDIMLPSGIRLSVFDDKNRTVMSENPLKLKFGLNTYYLVLSTLNENIVLTENWDLMITRNKVPDVLISKIEVKELKQNYKLNEEFSNGVLLVTYTNNTTKEVEITKEMIKGFDTSKAGEKLISITYEGNTITFKINVAKTITDVVMGDYKNSYFVNDKEFSGKLIVKYDDNSEMIVDITSSMITNFDTTNAGNKEVTINYEGFSKTIIIEVLENTLESISVTDDVVTKYDFNAPLPKINVLATYKNGDVKEVEAKVSGFNSSKVGKQTITLTYEDKSTTLEIEIKNAVLNIEVIDLKDSYIYKEEFKPGKLLVTYADKTTKEIDITLDMVSGFDTTKLGKTTLVITYEGMTVSKEITVLNKAIKLEILELQSIYNINDTFKEGTLKVTYLDSTTKEVKITKEMVSGFDTTSVGEKNITISYEGLQITHKIVVNKNIISVSKKDIQTTYFVGDEDFVGTILVEFDDKSNITVKVTKEMVSGFNTTKTGDLEVIIKYENYNLKVNIKVIENTVEKITIKDGFSYVYNYGDKLEKVKVIATYKKGNTLEVEALVSNFNSNKVGKQTITLTYKGVTLNVEIEVLNYVTEISVEELKDTYKIKEEFTNGKLRVTYANGETKVIDLVYSMVSGFDTTQVGEKEITITYDKFSVKYTIYVNSTISNVELINNKTTYYVGEKNFTGNLKVIFDNGEHIILTIKSEMISGFDTSSTGNKEVQITYGEFVVKSNIDVLENGVARISAISDTKRKYTYGDKLETIYVDVFYLNGQQSREVATVDGFDSLKVGKQTLILKFDNKTTTLEIEVLNYVKNIAINEFKTNYILNGAFVNGKLLVTYADDSTKIVEITSDMVTGFDTTSLGEKSLIVTYEDKTVAVTINVLKPSQILTNAYVSVLDRKYLQNDNFTNGLLTVVFSDEHTETIEITLDMVTGFDTTTTGWKTITIKFKDFIFEEQILVSSKIYGDYELPTPIELDAVKFKQIFKDINLSLNMSDAQFEELWQRDSEYILGLFSKAGINEETFNAIYNLYYDEGKVILDEFFGNPGLFLENLTVEKVQKTQILIKKVLQYVTVEQITILIVEAIYGDNGFQTHFRDIWYFGYAFGEYTFDDIKKLVNNPIIDKVSDFFRHNGSIMKPNKELMFKDISKLLDYAKHIILALTNVNAEDIVNFSKEIIPIAKNSSAIANHIDGAIKYGVKIIRQLVRNTNNFEGYDDILPILNNYFLLSGNNPITDLTLYEIIGFGLKHAEFLLNIIEQLTAEVIADLLNIPAFMNSEDININNSGLKGYVYLGKLTAYLYDYLVQNDKELLNKIRTMFSANMMSYIQFDKTIENSKEVSKLDPNNINFSNLEELQNSVEMQVVNQFIMTAMEYEGFTFPHLIVLPVLINSDRNEFIKALKHSIELTYQGAPINNNLLKIGEFDLTTRGPKLVEITFKSFVFNVQYIVLEQDEFRVQYETNNYRETIFVNKNTENLEVYIINRLKASYLDSVYLYLANYTPECWWYSFKKLIYEYNIHFDENKYGKQIITIEHKTPLGSLYDFAQIVIYDEENPYIEVEDKYYNVSEDKGYSYEIYLLVSINGKGEQATYNVMFTKEEFKGLSTGDFITKEIVVYTSPSGKEIKHQIKFKYYKPEDRDTISNIKVKDYVSLPITNPEDNFAIARSYFLVSNYSGDSRDYSSFNELAKNYKNSNGLDLSYEIIFDTKDLVIKKDYKATIKFYLGVNESKKLINEDSLNVHIISDVEFYEGHNYDANYKEDLILHHQIASRNDITIDLVYSLLINNVEYITKSYRYIDKKEIYRDESSIRKYFYNVLETNLRIFDYDHYYKYDDWRNKIYFYLEENKDAVVDFDLKALKPLFMSEITNLDTIVEDALTSYYNLELVKANGEVITLLGKEAYEYLKSIGARVDNKYNEIVIIIENKELSISKQLYIYIIDDVNGKNNFNATITLNNGIKNENITKENFFEFLTKNNAKLEIIYTGEGKQLAEYSIDTFFKNAEITELSVDGESTVNYISFKCRIKNIGVYVYFNFIN